MNFPRGSPRWQQITDENEMALAQVIVKKSGSILRQRSTARFLHWNNRLSRGCFGLDRCGTFEVIIGALLVRVLIGYERINAASCGFRNSCTVAASCIPGSSQRS